MIDAGIAARVAACVGACALVPHLAGCLDHPVKPVEYDSSQAPMVTVDVNPNKDVDILFVIDNSGSMGEEQATLSSNFASFIDVLEAEDVDANYRIGITTTDNGNAACSGTTPEGGAFVMRPCVDRLEDFVFAPNTAGEVDKQAEACTDLCAGTFAGAEVRPTALEPDGPEAPRPWLERVQGVSNLPDDMDTVQGFQCFGPQGINGCGFESPLESMYKALARATDQKENQFGFVRDNALLSVVFVTDEADCSARNEHGDVFLATGDQALWSDPSAPVASSAVCWRAGVECSGGPGTYDECHSAHIGPDGNPTDADGAILHPLDRYVELLQTLEDRKNDGLSSHRDVLVSVISGVPGDGENIEYKDSTDPEFQDNFGIGEGCASANGRAVPPVRLAEFADAFAVGEEQNLFSVCSADYKPALKAIADRIRDQLKPACLPACARDTDPSVDGVQPLCTLTEESRTGDKTPIQRCVGAPGAWDLPDGEDACFVMKTGAELHPQCVDAGNNVEFEVIRRPGVPAPTDSTILATCEVSPIPSIDCPDL